MKLTFVLHDLREERRQHVQQIMDKATAAGLGPPEGEREKALEELTSGDVYIDTTKTYQVVMRRAKHGWTETGPEFDLWHLSIKRIDKEPIHDWRVMQAIKNAVLGEECEAVELYPAESRVVDTVNQYHLYGFKNPWPKQGFPFGFTKRAVTNDLLPGIISGSKQRAR